MSITLSVPPTIVQEVRAYAAEHDTSLNQMVRDFLSSVVKRESSVDAAADAFGRLVKAKGVKRKTSYRFRRADAYDEEA